MGFAIQIPARILFGRGEAAKAPGLIRAHGARVLIVHGASGRHVPWLSDQIATLGGAIQGMSCPAEPTLPMLEQALAQGRRFAPEVVVALGGGAVQDMGKALAALIPAPSPPMDHLEVVGRGLPLSARPLPFIAMPTTAGTGAEATKNAVIGVPEYRVKVSLRDDRMLAQLAIVDPALTDDCPWPVTLASGMDAVVQVIEPYLSTRANDYTDALTRQAIPRGLRAIQRLSRGEDAAARDDLAWVSLTGGIALANAGLGAVHGLAGPIGGMSPAAHGALCAVLLGPVLAMNRQRAAPGNQAARRIDEVCSLIAESLGGSAQDAPQSLSDWLRRSGLPGLTAQGLAPGDHGAAARAALSSSSIKANPVPLTEAELLEVLAQAAP